jgi:hypothetical protein
MLELKGEGTKGLWVCNPAVTMGRASAHKQRDEGKARFLSRHSLLLSYIAYFGEHLFRYIVLEVHNNHALI